MQMREFTAKEIIQLRKELRLSRRELANVSGLSIGLIQSIEVGARPITKATNVKLNKVVHHIESKIGDDWSTYVRCSLEIDAMVNEGIDVRLFA